mmetsp:Transcript_41726/g.61735  ORF Transcript_41726/g.61735 Transcript_41726/m.61735 type:complete len:222 (-) Transcript_41726:258-923(-)
MTRTKQHIPSSEELKDAITAATKVETTTKPTAKSMQDSLQKMHPDWKLPERRVQKFLKKVTKATPGAVGTIAGSDDESMATTNSNATNGSRFRKMFGKGDKTKKSRDKVHKENSKPSSFRKKKLSKKAKKKAAAAAEAAAAETAEEVSASIETAPSKDEVEEAAPESSLLGAVASTDVEDEVLATPQTTDTEATEENVELYADDNDGKKDQAQLCEGCVIL